MAYFVIVAVMCLDFSLADLRHEPVWTYDDERSWPGTRCKEGGMRQSPIDIKTSDVVDDFAKQFIKYGPLVFSGYHSVLVSGVNNGYTVQFSCDGEESIHPTLTGGPLQHKYRLEQVHFHWPSEHSINGVKYPMEIHFVHVRADLTVKDALKNEDGLTIVSVFCNVQTELNEPQQESSKELMEYVPKLLNTGERISGIILNMTKLLSVNYKSYYTYAGSLTSPDCNEAVIWIIFDTPIYLTDAQYRLFSKVRRHNFRALQTLNQHIVYRPPHATFNTPQIVKLFDEMVQVVTEFFRFMTKGFKTR